MSQPMPNIKLYARFEAVGTQKTPKFAISHIFGYYPPMDELRGRGGQISMYLMQRLKEGSDAPAMRLQAKDSFNFTGLKEYYTDGGRLSGFAYGYPPDTPTYSQREKHNPFYEVCNDGFLFLFAGGTPTDPTPRSFELLVLEGAKHLIAAYCKMLINGGFDPALTEFRKMAKPLT